MKKLLIVLVVMLLAVTGFPLQGHNSITPKEEVSIVEPQEHIFVSKIIISPTPKRPIHATRSRPSLPKKSHRVVEEFTVWDRLVQCEASGDWHANTGNGFYGGLQFTSGTYNSFGGTGSASNASRSEQIRVARNVLSVQGWKAWPACSRKLGLR